MEVLKTEETFCLTYHIGTSVTHYYAWSVHLNYLYDCAEEKKTERKEKQNSTVYSTGSQERSCILMYV
jgi:hypothetical protein